MTTSRLLPIGILLAVLAVDLATKWVMYGESQMNPGISRLDGWLILVGVVVWAAGVAALVSGILITRGITRAALAAWLGGALGQGIQFGLTGSVSDWIAVGPVYRVTLWTNIADLAVLVGAIVTVIQWTRWVQAGPPLRGIRVDGQWVLSR